MGFKSASLTFPGKCLSSHYHARAHLPICHPAAAADLESLLLHRGGRQHRAREPGPSPICAPGICRRRGGGRSNTCRRYPGPGGAGAGGGRSPSCHGVGAAALGFRRLLLPVLRRRSVPGSLSFHLGRPGEDGSTDPGEAHRAARAAGGETGQGAERGNACAVPG